MYNLIWLSQKVHKRVGIKFFFPERSKASLRWVKRLTWIDTVSLVVELRLEQWSFLHSFLHVRACSVMSDSLGPHEL